MSDKFEEILREVEADEASQLMQAADQSPAEMTLEPAPAPAATAPTSGSDNSAWDLAKLNEQVRAYGNHEIKSPDDVVRVLGDMHKGMKQAQADRIKAVEEGALAQARLRRQMPSQNQETDPRFQPQFQSQAPEYAQPQYDPAVQDLLQWRAETELRSSLERLEADPTYKGFVTPEVRSEVMLRCVADGNYDPEGVFLKMYKQQIVDHVRESTRRELMDAIKTNNSAGAGLMPTTVSAPSAIAPIDPATLPPEQADKWLDAEIQKIVSNPKYAAEVARRGGGSG